jgi:hypothetical protein
LKKIIISLIFVFTTSFCLGQINLSSNKKYFELIRNYQLVNFRNNNSGFLTRSLNFSNDSVDTVFSIEFPLIISKSFKNSKFELRLLPTFADFQINMGYPYPENSNFLESRGMQKYLSSGFFGFLGHFSFHFQPEFSFSQNNYFTPSWPKGGGIEYVQLYGTNDFFRLSLGQSNFRFNFGSFSTGVSTENIWWGPGQYNSLLFSSNAFGFQHFTFNTKKPAKTFLGSFEGQLILGKLENFEPFSRKGKEDWRYLNGVTLSYQPKWLPGLFFGASRVFQQYRSFNNKTLAYFLPIFEPFQKNQLVDPNSPDFDTTDYDDRLQSQQLTGFARLVIPKAKAEIYFEYGRRDHSVDWREFLLNPEHARAYLLGFKKLIALSNGAFFQINGEMLQQQESINILTRYGFTGGQSWATHGIKQGFTHQGQLLGPGIGPSSNVQTIETSWVNGVKKIGVRWERLNRHQDVYTRSFNDPSENGRWVDYSVRLLADWQFDKMLVSTTTNFVYSLNSQWGLADTSTPQFPKGKNVFSTTIQMSLIYFWGRSLNKKD